MRRYGILSILALVILFAAVRSFPSHIVSAAPLIGPGITESPTATASVTRTPTGSPTMTATPTRTGTTTQTPTKTTTPTKTQTPTKTATPTISATVDHYFPIVVRQPTFTPTSTYTPSPTFTPSATPTVFNCNGRFDGNIRLEDNKPTYATFIEWVKFLQSVRNNNNSNTCFGILGFDTVRPDGSHMPYNSQWSAQGVPSKFLTIFANCWGPNGQPCAGSQDSGQQEDHVGTGPYLVTQVGQYTVYYTVCYSNFDACQSPGSNWAILGSIQFSAINWTPSAPSGTEAAPTPSEPVANAPLCYLVTNDPRGTYLDCNTSHLKERQLFHH